MSSLSRGSLIAWCHERAAANRHFDGTITPYAARLMKDEWPAYFEAIAQMLAQDCYPPKPGAPNE